MRKKSYRDAILRRLNYIRRVNPMGYAQILMMPFGPVPSDAMLDKNHEWWTSEEAKERFESLASN